MGDTWDLNESIGRKHSGLMIGLAAFIVTLAISSGVVAALTTYGQGSVQVTVGPTASYPITVAFYADAACTQLVTDISCPKGGDNTIYVKLHNGGASDYLNLEVVAGGASGLWVNLYNTAGTTTYFKDGIVVTKFNLASGADLIMKAQLGLPSTATEGSVVDLVVTVQK